MKTCSNQEPIMCRGKPVKDVTGVAFKIGDYVQVNTASKGSLLGAVFYERSVARVKGLTKKCWIIIEDPSSSSMSSITDHIFFTFRKPENLVILRDHDLDHYNGIIGKSSFFIFLSCIKTHLLHCF